MLTLEQALAWHPSGVSQAGDQLGSLGMQLDGAYLTMTSARNSVAASWDDDASRLALAKMQQWADDVSTYSTRLQSTATDLDDLGQLLSEAQGKLRAMVSAARDDGNTVTSAGLVIPPKNPMYNTHSKVGMEFPPYVPGALDQARGYEQQIQQLLAQMTAIDANIAGVLEDLSAASVDIAVTGSTRVQSLPEVPQGMTSAQAAQWWATLSPAGRDALLNYALPALYGIRGLPATVEDEVNRARLDQEYQLTATMEAAAAQSGDPSASYWTQANSTCAKMQQYLSEWDAGASTSAAAALPPGTPLLLIGFSSLVNGGKGSAVVAMGNPDTANNVSGFIEGVGSSPSNLPFQNAAAILAEQDHVFDDGGNNAMVIYQSGPMPDSVPGAVDQSDAETYADDYARDINAVIDSHQTISGDGNYVVFSHSYGTEELTRAMVTRGLGIRRLDSVVMLASPGVNVDSTSSYGINPQHVYAATADGDPISYFANTPAQIISAPLDWILDPGSGALHDPTTFAHVFQVTPGGHSSYFQSPQDLYELARIAEGESP